MPTVGDVLRQYGPEYLKRFGDSMPAEQRKVLRTIMACRTGQLGTVYYQCLSCGRTHVMGRSCGNRHCPSCQQDKAKAWLDSQTARLLPCPYFLITFTVPAELRDFVRSHPRQAYHAMFEASSGTLKALAADPKYVGTNTPGFFGVLHTWGRTLEYHPHIHYVVPGGGLSDDGQSWLPSRADYFAPYQCMAIVYRAKFRDCLKRAGLLHKVDPAVWQRDWIVDSKAVGDGRGSLQYLAPYVFRVSISDRRLIACEPGPDGEGEVTFLYRKSGTSHWRKMRLDAMEFIRRFLQHVLPSGFQKVRHYGFLSPNSAQSIESLQWLVAVYCDLLILLLGVTVDVAVEPPCIRCAECGATMVLIGFVPPYKDDT
jgi:hypothetical protein